jgi:hypothetical protein
MVRTHRPWLTWVAGSVLLLAATGAHAIYLDEDDNVTLRARIYSQGSIRVEDSSATTVPVTEAGQLIQHRNFFNPELDAKLTSYLNWMKGGALDWLMPDDLRFRIAGWGFYDGIYDYGTSQFNTQERILNASFNNGVQCPNRTASGACLTVKPGGWFTMGPNIKLQKAGGTFPNLTPSTFGTVFPGYQVDNPRSIYGDTERVNELYLSYSKGPFFLRFGRQSISWGESDTIALLDQSNPFDLTLGAPGFFEDIDEARIPLYTARASYNLFDSLGPLSSGFVESYWVPGDLDATTATTPILTVSPYSPRGVDPQLLGGNNVSQRVFPPTFQFVFFDHTLKQDFSSSRWGFRFQTVIDRFLTMQAWIYRTFPTSPVPVHLGFQQGKTAAGNPIPPPPININGTNLYVVSLEHKPVMVYGLAGTFFFEPLDSIIRLDAQLFEHEAGFIPEENLRICKKTFTSAPDHICQQKNLSMLTSAGAIPYADILRYEIGLDRFFFFRPLNPTNSFILSTSVVGSYNSSFTSQHDFRYQGQLKPGDVIRPGQTTPSVRGTVQDDFVNNEGPLDAQGQITLQTDYMHGRLEPRLTLIGFVRGTYAIHPTLSYRWNDWLLFQADYQRIDGAYQSIGFFRDRDQVSFRVTYQLN